MSEGTPLLLEVKNFLHAVR